MQGVLATYINIEDKIVLVKIVNIVIGCVMNSCSLYC